MLTQYRPIHPTSKFLFGEIEEEEQHKNSCCMKILLEAGADLSLEYHHHNDVWLSTFMYGVLSYSIVSIVTHDKA
jgi:hypothetical protein